MWEVMAMTLCETPMAGLGVSRGQNLGVLECRAYGSARGPAVVEGSRREGSRPWSRQPQGAAAVG